MSADSKNAKRFSFNNKEGNQENNDLISPLLPDSLNENKDEVNSKVASLQSFRIGTPTFNPILTSNHVLKMLEDRELDLFSPAIQTFKAKLASISLPDRIQLVKRMRIDYYGKHKLGFDIHSMDQSLELEESLFNHDEFSINFGGLDLLEFTFQKAEGIKMNGKRSNAEISVDQEMLEKFRFKNFNIGISVEGDSKKIGHIRKVAGVYMILDKDDAILYKIQKVDNFIGKCQKVFILNEREDVVGGLDLVHLNESTMACTVLFPPEISNIDKLLLIGTVFVLMMKIAPLKEWVNQLNSSKSSYIYHFLKKIFSRLCPRRH